MKTKKLAKRYSSVSLGRDVETTQHICALDTKFISTRFVQSRVNLDDVFLWHERDGGVRDLPLSTHDSAALAAPPAPAPVLLVPRHRVKGSRSADAANPRKRDEQAKAVHCNECHETDPMSTADLDAERKAVVTMMLSFSRDTSSSCSLPASSRILFLATRRVHDNSSVLLGWTRGSDGEVEFLLASHGFQIWVAADLRFATTPIRVDLRFLLTEAAQVGCSIL